MSGKKVTLGRSLMKKPQKDPRERNRGYVEEFANEQEEPKNLNSVIDHSDLGAIMENALLENTRFTAEKQNVVVLETSAFIEREKPTEEQINAQQKHWNDLTIPRRPEWTPDMSGPELDRIEKASFLAWRRKLADMEENDHLLLTPFEKNIEVWRQLWRVLERSDMVVQILDSRDPLLFRSVDLEKYVAEFKTRQPYPQEKVMLLMLNKADLLTVEQRKYWADYFTKEGIRFIFFSAYAEQVLLNEELKEEKAKQLEESTAAIRRNAQNIFSTLAEDSDSDDDDEEDDKEDEAEDEKTKEEEQKEEVTEKPITETKADINITHSTDHVFTREELFDYFTRTCHQEAKVKKDHYMIGMVGYPNVGKSSTINVLYHRKKVAVSSTPGKTKHFQTLKVNDGITLCDCPGLVFPTFMSTRAEMTASGLLRIDEMKEHLGPVSIITRRIPKHVLESTYGIDLPFKDLTAAKFLQVYAEHRGFVTLLNKPDEAKAARIVLKDFVNGRLLFCRSPPDVDQELYSSLTVHPTIDATPEEQRETAEAIMNGEVEEVVEEEKIEAPDDGFPKPSQRPKHMRVNKKMERRLKHMDEREPNRNLEAQKSIGMYVAQNPTAFGRLPTNVRMVKENGKRPVAYIKPPVKK